MSVRRDGRFGDRSARAVGRALAARCLTAVVRATSGVSVFDRPCKPGPSTRGVIRECLTRGEVTSEW